MDPDQRTNLVCSLCNSALPSVSRAHCLGSSYICSRTSLLCAVSCAILRFSCQHEETLQSIKGGRGSRGQIVTRSERRERPQQVSGSGPRSASVQRGKLGDHQVSRYGTAEGRLWAISASHLQSIDVRTVSHQTAHGTRRRRAVLFLFASYASCISRSTTTG